MLPRLLSYFKNHPFALVVILTPCLGALFILFQKRMWDKEALARKWWMESTFESVVVNRYAVPNSRGEVHVIVETRGVKQDLFWPGFYRQLTVGDSLLKVPGSQAALIKRQNGDTTSFYLFPGEQRLIKWE